MKHEWIKRGDSEIEIIDKRDVERDVGDVVKRNIRARDIRERERERGGDLGKERVHNIYILNCKG